MAEHGHGGGHGAEHGGGHGGHGGGGGFLEKFFTDMIEGAADLAWKTGAAAPTDAVDVIKDIVSTGKGSKGGGGHGGGGHGHH